MNIAYVTLSGRGLIDDCISATVALLQYDGVRIAGTVRAATADSPDHPCDMDVRVLPDGPLCRISQPLGTGSHGCRLDGGAIETLAAMVEARLADADLLVVNKFGKQEALGRGLCTAIVRASELGIPVLVGVNGLNLPEFIRFAGGLATRLPPEPRAVLAWANAALAAPTAIAV